VPRGRIKNGGKKKRELSSPRHQYVYSMEPITIDKLAEEWKGIKGCTLANLWDRSRKEGWVEKRKMHWERVEARVAHDLEVKHAARREKQIEDANLRHIQLGQSYQYGAGKILKEHLPDTGNIDTDKALRLVPSLGDKGVTIERKGLGLEQTFIMVAHTKEITIQVIQILKKYVTDPVVFENIVKDLEGLDPENKEKLKELKGEVE
jgi:hypothetical protein